MKGTETFKICIQEYLNKAAEVNPIFAKKMENPKKNIDECINYILSQVKSSGANGFEDTEIYGIAMHYYDDENVKVSNAPQANVIINHHVELTEKEKEELREEARQKVLQEEMDRLRGKDKKKTTQPKPNSGDHAIGTLFDKS